MSLPRIAWPSREATMADNHKVLLVAGEAIARYGFPNGHPFGTDRHEAFMTELKNADLEAHLVHGSPRQATRDELRLFHTDEYIQRVVDQSQTGLGFLDSG